MQLLKQMKKKEQKHFEIRVCSKEAYISEQSAYYSVQKNDTTNLPMETKNNLRNLVQHITYKLALLNTRELSKLLKCQYEDFINAIKDE